MRQIKVLLALAVVGLGFVSAAPNVARADHDGGGGCSNSGGYDDGDYDDGGYVSGGYGGGGYGGYGQQGQGGFGGYYGNGGHDAAPHWHQTQTLYGTAQWYGNGAHDFQPHGHTYTPNSYTSYSQSPWGNTQSFNSRYPSTDDRW